MFNTLVKSRSAAVSALSGLLVVGSVALGQGTGELKAAPGSAGKAAMVKAEPVLSAYAASTADYEAQKSKAKGGTVYTLETVPDWTGLWRRIGNPETMDASPIVAALTPKYKADYEAKRARIAKGVEWDRLSWCLPMGMPRWLADPWMHEFVVQPKQTWMLYEQLQEERRIYTDGRGHVPESVAIPLWEGDSIGFWDGDTLVIHTTHMKAGEYWRGSPEISFSQSTIERVHKVDENILQDDITVYDPVSLTKPVHLTYQYRKQADKTIRMDHDSCEEGNNNYRTAEGSTGTLLPGEPGYREPTTFGIAEISQDTLPK